MEQRIRFRVDFSTLLKGGYVCLICIFLYGCAVNKHEEWPYQIEIDESIKSKAIQLKAEIVEQSMQFINAKDFFVYNDSVLIVLNKPHKSNPFVIFHNLNTNRDIAKYINLGNGPGEMLNCIAHIRNSNLYVHDFVKNILAIIDIDSVLISGETYKLDPFIRFSNNVGSPFVTMYDDDTLIMLNPYCFIDKNLGIDNRQPRFIISEIGKDSGLILNSKLYYTYNVSQGVVIPSIDRNRVVFASCFTSEIEFYDYNLNPILKVDGPVKMKPSYRCNANKDISFNKIVPYSYMSYCIDDDSIYFSYVGDYFTKEKQLHDFDSLIIEIDWSGNIGNVYHSPEYIKTISKSEKLFKFYSKIILWQRYAAWLRAYRPCIHSQW